RHESEHYTGSNAGDEGTDYRASAQYGDALVADLALAQRLGAFLLVERLQASLFIPDRSSYAAAPALDLHARWTALPWLHPFTSAFCEHRFGTTAVGRAYPDAYLVRGMAGVALPSPLGDVMVFATGEVGHRAGLLVGREEAGLGVGVRLG